jgi:hypothetical protein
VRKRPDLWFEWFHLSIAGVRPMIAELWQFEIYDNDLPGGYSAWFEVEL